MFRPGQIVRVALVLGTMCLAALPTVAQDERDPLTRARLAYNRRQFDVAIASAEEARRVPARADAADLIAARAYLERFRETAASDDLANARVRLRSLSPEKLTPRDRVDYAVGLGEALFLEDAAGAAADVFESVLMKPEALAPEARERVLDWWANAVDREARRRPDPDRQSAYQRVRDRMRAELGLNPGSATAAYWAAAAARGQGDLRAAWDAVRAGWVRATLAADRGVALRDDLDQLVQRALVPERARALAAAPEALQMEWEQFKAQWNR